MGKIVDHVLVVLMALLFMQLPLFMHQYQLQLTGRVAEMQWQMNHMQASASASGKDLDQYTRKFLTSSDTDISRQGEMMQRIQTRSSKLSKALSKLQTAHALARPFFFLFYFQWDIAQSTAEAFQPGLPLTIEGLLYAILGMSLGYGFYRVLAKMWKKLIKAL